MESGMSEQQQSRHDEVFDEAIELALEEDTPYPERATFLDVEKLTGTDIEEAAAEDRSVVLVDADGHVLVLTVKPLARPRRPDLGPRRTSVRQPLP